MRTAKLVVALCLSVGMTGCTTATQLLQGGAGQQVTVKAQDPTAPSAITLETQGRVGGDVILNLGMPTMAITMGKAESFLVRAIVEDPDGVKDVAIWGTDERTCMDPTTGVAQKSGPGFAGAPLILNPDPATAGGMAYTKRYVSYTVKVNTTCPGNLRFLSQTFTFRAEGTNFSGLIAKGPELTITAN